jgi:hypothetical protein
VCYIQWSTLNALTVCRKKKRSIGFNPVSKLDEGQSILPNPTLKAKDEEILTKIYEISDSKQIDEEREAKFLNYWMTTTVITTYTSYTVTSSIASVVCTPAGYTDAGCPGNAG